MRSFRFLSDFSTNHQRRPWVMPRPGNYSFGSFRMDGRLRRLFDGERLVHLKPKEWELLSLLIEQRDRVLSKDELLDTLWPRQAVMEANLTQTLYRVRQALGDSAREARWIETVPRLGYRFVGEVRETDSGQGRPWPRSVAVLPFVDNEGEEEGPPDRSLGLTDAVIRALGADPSLEVRSLGAVFHDAGNPASRAREALDVEAVIEGTVDSRGDGLVIEARLTDAGTGRCHWTRHWHLDRDDVQAGQRLVSAEIFDALGGTPGTRIQRPARAHGEVPPAARTAYLRGRYCWHQFTEPMLRRSIELFDEALELVPRFAEAHAWRSGAWSALGNIGALSPRDSAEHARRGADRAIAMDDRLGVGFEMRGVVEMYFDWNFEAALRSFDFAIERDPLSANAHHLRGNALAFAGSFGPAMHSIERALQLDPTALITLTDAGVVRYLAGRQEDALASLMTALSQNPHFSHARIKLAFVLAALGRYDEAVGETDRVADRLGSERFGERACFLGLAGRSAEARDILATLPGEPGEGTVDPHDMALGCLGIGELDDCLIWLERAVDYRSRQLVQLRLDPIWRPLRREQRFQDLVRRVGFALPWGIEDGVTS